MSSDNPRLHSISSDLALLLAVIGITVLFGHEVFRSLGYENMKIAYSGFFILFASLIVSILKGTIGLLDTKYMIWLIVMGLYALFMFTYGYLLNEDLRFISRDVWPFFYFAGLLVALDNRNDKILDKMFYYHFTIALFVTIYLWIVFGIDITRIKISEIIRSEEDVQNVYLGWQLLFAWPYMLLTFGDKTTIWRKIITGTGITIYFTLAIIFNKRLPLLSLFILLGLVLVFRFKQSSLTSSRVDFFRRSYLKRVKLKKTIIFAFVLIALGTSMKLITATEEETLISPIEKLMDRYTIRGDLTTTFLLDDRIAATASILSQDKGGAFIHGKGFGSTVERDLGPNNTLEGGLASFHLKGGILYVILWYAGLLGIIFHALFVTKVEPFLNINYFILITYVTILSPISSFFNMFPYTGYVLLWMGQCLGQMKPAK